MPYDNPGISTYISSTGASTHVIRSGSDLLSARFFAAGTTGHVEFYLRTTSTGQAGAVPVKVRSGVGFDWTPAAKWSPCVICVSSAVDFFGEVSSHG